MGKNGRRLIIGVIALAFLIGAAGVAVAAVQDKYALPEPYLAWEKAYLKEFPELQGLMDVMIATAVRQLKEPGGDILHNRVCSALAYEMGKPLAGQDWEKIRPELVKLMDLKPDEDPIKVLGVPKIFQ